jgi:hypothetical protein
VFFKIVGQILDVEIIASDKGVRERRRLRKLYGGHRWRKLKGRQQSSWPMVRCVMPKCEAHGAGTKEIKIKRILEIQ